MTAAHKCFNELIRAVIQHRKRKGSIEFVTEDKDVSFKKIRGKSALRHLCTAEQVEQVAKQSYYELEHNQELGSDLEDVDIEKFWRQRPDRMAIDLQKRIIYIVEFKRTISIAQEHMV